ncbi:MAG TPA: alpha/beta hydrolase [Pseudomonadota bacterium]|nr:alpha/beta hydrolase [Pseudomonadota bacterium]
MTRSSAVQQRNHVRVVGQGGKTLVFSHGFGTDQTAWHQQEAAFRPEHRLVLFDLVGAGKSELAAYSPRRYRTMHSYAEDLLEILAELQLRDVIYVGHSMSGIIGLLAALQEPERFAKMIFLSASPRYLNDSGYIGGFEQADIDALYAAMAGNYQSWASGFGPIVAANPDRPEVASAFVSTLSAIRPDIALAVARMVYQSDHRADLPGLRVPTLIVQSSDDVAVPIGVGEYLAHNIPGARYLLINARGHLAHMSAPDEVNRAIRSFLD